jgi:hypothetical protein
MFYENMTHASNCILMEIDSWEPTQSQEAALNNGISSWAEVSAHHYDPFDHSFDPCDGWTMAEYLEAEAKAEAAEDDSVPFDPNPQPWEDDCPF